MQGDEGYAVLSGLEEDADKVVEAAESNEAVADAARQAADAANEVAAAVDGMRSDVSSSLKDIRASIKSMGAAASPIADMQEALETDRASMAEALGVLREISAAMRTFESLGGTQHPDGTNGGAWAPEDMGALAEGITGPIVAAINELTEKGKSEAETQRSAVTSTTRTTSEAAVRMGERIDGSFSRLSDAFSASMRDLMEAEQRRHEESMRRIDAVQAASSGIDRAQALAGSAVQVENLLRDALRGGFDVRKLAPQLASAIGSAFPAIAEGFEHAENLKALPQKAAQQAASKVRPGDGDEVDRYDVEEPSPRSKENQDARDVENVRDEVEEPDQRSTDEQDARDVENVRYEVEEPSSRSLEEHGADRGRDEDDGTATRSPEEQDAMDVENVRDGVLSALRDHDGEVERSEELEAGREREEAVSVIEEGTESIPQAVGESVADEVSDSAAQQQQGLDAGLDVAAQPEQAMGFGGSLLERAIGLVSGTRIGKALGRTKVGEKALGIAEASAVGKAAGEAGASAVGKAAVGAGAAAGAEAAGSAVAKALGTAGEAIGGAVSKALGPIGLALTAYEGVQAALDIGQGLANASISQTGRADAVQGASISAQLGAQRAAATMTSALTDDQAKSIQDTLTSSGMRYDDEDFSEAFEFAKQMNLRYGVDVTQAARQYVDSVKRGTSSADQLYKSMDLLADVSDRTGQSFTSLQEGYEKAVDDLTDSTGSSSLANAIANAVLEAGGSAATLGAQANIDSFVSGNPVLASDNDANLDRYAQMIKNPETGDYFSSYSEMRKAVYSDGLTDTQRKDLERQVGNVQTLAKQDTFSGKYDFYTASQASKTSAKNIGTYISGWNIDELVTGRATSSLTEDNRDATVEMVLGGLIDLGDSNSYTSFTTEQAMDYIRNFFGDDKRLETENVRDFSESLVDILLESNATRNMMGRDVTRDKRMDAAISSGSDTIDVSANQADYFSDETLPLSFGLVSSNRGDVIDNKRSEAFSNVTGDGVWHVDKNGNYIYDQLDTIGGLMDATLSDQNKSGNDFTDDNVTDWETETMTNYLLENNFIPKDDFEKLTPETARVLVEELSKDFAVSYESGESSGVSDYLSSNRDTVTEDIRTLMDRVSDYNSKNAGDLDSGGAVKELQNLNSTLSNGLSMDVTINADGIGNIATAVANCQTKSSSDAGTNG